MEALRRDVFISWADLVRLEHQIEMARLHADRDTQYLERLKAHLDRALIIGQREVPPDVVTMRSRVRLRDPEAGMAAEYELVFPNHADPGRGKLSVLAPAGAALLGAYERERVSWETPAGRRETIVEKILYQPEVEEGHQR